MIPVSQKDSHKRNVAILSRGGSKGRCRLGESARQSRLPTAATEGLGLDDRLCGLWLLVLPVPILDSRLLTASVTYDRLEERVLHHRSLGGRHDHRYRDWWLVGRFLDQQGLR